MSFLTWAILVLLSLFKPGRVSSGMEHDRENGFSLRVRLGDLLTMFVVLIMAAGTIGSATLGYVSIIERITTLEAKIVQLQVDVTELKSKNHK